MTVVLDLHELNDLSRALRKVAPEVNREFQSEIKGAVDRHVADRARAKAAWSRNIPGTIKTTRNGLTVKVRAGGAGEPAGHKGEAAAYEHNGVPGKFRHPVYGHRDRKWGESDAKPFITPAGIEGADGVVTDCMNAVERVIELGLR